MDDTGRRGATQEEVELTGTLRAIVYQAPASTWIVARFELPDELFPMVAVGDMVAPSIGDAYRLTGEWVQHPKYGRQFKWSSYEIVYPQTRDGVERYLASGLIRGIGRTFARRIVERFGAEAIDILNTEIERLLEVDGIGPKKLDAIREAWDEQRGVQRIMLFLKEHSVGTAHAVRIYHRYGHAAVDIIRMDPYRLSEEIDGIGFRTADAIAVSLGMQADNPRRLAAGALHVLTDAARSNGHVYIPRDELARGAAAVLGVDEDQVRDAVRAAEAEGRLVVSADRVFLPELYLAERDVVEALQRLYAAEPPRIDHAALNTLLAETEARMGIRFAPVQAEAVHACLSAPVTILTGGPGTGKTTTVAGIIDVAEHMGLSVVLCAPTGRAARRMAWLSGRDARTIHRLLEFDPRSGLFMRNEERRLETDVIVVDEVSMVDVQLMAALLAAVPAGVRLVLVGDADQLPSVGPGAVLEDLIASERIPTVTLHVIFRQAESSRIVTNAHRVRAGFIPVCEQDTFMVDTEAPDAIPSAIRELVTDRIPRDLQVDPVRDIQVLSPMHNTPSGVKQLNVLLQQALNPSGRVVLHRGERVWRLGDKVMQTRNNYEKDVFNGDIGFISAVDDDEALITISFDGRPVSYVFDEMDDVTHAYAITVHKSQGSEYPVVVMPVSMQHRVMLYRNLLYTGMTRARQLLVFVGQRTALAVAVRTERGQNRYTGLRDLLRHAPGM